MISVKCLTLLLSVSAGTCGPGHLAVYSLQLETFWTEELFPRQFPLWRPPASWSQTLGATHRGELRMFREGEEASQGLGNMAETGDSLLLESELLQSTALLNTSNVFHVLPLTSGSGTARTNIFVDGVNSKVRTVGATESMMVINVLYC